MHYDVTIGIPVYQVENYIKRTMESVLSQTYPSIEFLIIDDGSVDASPDIVRSFIKDHPRGIDVRLLVHRTNMGVSETRNHIIDEARGDFLYFMDSDDVIAPNTISLLMSQIKEFKADVAFGSYERIEITGERKLFQYPKAFFFEQDSFAMYVYRKYAAFQASVCNYLVSISIIRDHNLRFFKSDFWEDMVFTLRLATIIRRAVLLPNVTYTYLCRENSLSNSLRNDQITKKHILQCFMAIESLKDEAANCKDKVYFPNMCYYAVKSDIYIICYILRKRNSIKPPFSEKELCSFLNHPSCFISVLFFKQKRCCNLLLLLLSKVPGFISLVLIRIYAWIKGFV